MSVISLVILFCDKRSFVAASQKIKTNEGTVYEFDRKMMCQLSPWSVEKLLHDSCRKKRKRILTGRLALGEFTFKSYCGIPIFFKFPILLPGLKVVFPDLFR